MAIKSGHPLRGISAFPPDIAGRLGELSVTTAEEFVSNALRDPQSIRSYLRVEPDRLDQLLAVAESVIDERALEEIRDFKPRQNGLGARKPHSEDFDSYRPERGVQG